MDNHVERRAPGASAMDRRIFLKASAGSMAALAVHSAYTMDALAQDTPALAGLQFFTDPQAETIEAIAEQIWPTTEDSPGARDAGVLYYIDGALAGEYQQYQTAYRSGLAWLDQAAEEEHGAVFRNLNADQQNALMQSIMPTEEDELEQVATPEVGAAEGGEARPPATPAAAIASDDGPPTVPGVPNPSIATLQDFMSIVLVHTMQGLFADPIYGGNRDFAGWRAVGYPGPYYVYTEELQQSFEPLNRPLQSIVDL